MAAAHTHHSNQRRRYREIVETAFPTAVRKVERVEGLFQHLIVSKGVILGRAYDPGDAWRSAYVRNIKRPVSESESV